MKWLKSGLLSFLHGSHYKICISSKRLHRYTSRASKTWGSWIYSIAMHNHHWCQSRAAETPSLWFFKHIWVSGVYYTTDISEQRGVLAFGCQHKPRKGSNPFLLYVKIMKKKCCWNIDILHYLLCRQPFLCSSSAFSELVHCVTKEVITVIRE